MLDFEEEGKLENLEKKPQMKERNHRESNACDIDEIQVMHKFWRKGVHEELQWVNTYGIDMGLAKSSDVFH